MAKSDSQSKSNFQFGNCSVEDGRLTCDLSWEGALGLASLCAAVSGGEPITTALCGATGALIGPRNSNTESTQTS